MVGTNIRQQLMNFVKDLKDQGVLDEHFDYVIELQNQGNHQFVVEVITMFLHDSENAIAELTRYLNESVVDYGTVISFLHQLRGSSSSVGGCRMALACREFRQASDDKNKERCIEAFEKLKQEYQILRDNFNIIVQTERTIVSNEARRRQGP